MALDELKTHFYKANFLARYGFIDNNWYH